MKRASLGRREELKGFQHSLIMKIPMFFNCNKARANLLLTFPGRGALRRWVVNDPQVDQNLIIISHRKIAGAGGDFLLGRLPETRVITMLAMMINLFAF